MLWFAIGSMTEWAAGSAAEPPWSNYGITEEPYDLKPNVRSSKPSFLPISQSLFTDSGTHIET
jgi:hypothetical protein